MSTTNYTSNARGQKNLLFDEQVRLDSEIRAIERKIANMDLERRTLRNELDRVQTAIKLMTRTEASYRTEISRLTTDLKAVRSKLSSAQ